MSTVLIELTNRCNLACVHCIDSRHRTDGDMKIEIIEKILSNARAQGFDFLSLTGGEPTLHPEFETIIKMTAEAGYTFGFVSNGWNFTKIYDKVLPFIDKSAGITFSLDGAGEKTHDRLRGKGSFRRLMKAVSICMVKDIQFAFHTLISSNNCDELNDMSELAMQLGAKALRFGHLVPTPLAAAHKLDLFLDKRRDVEAQIRKLQKNYDMPILLASGFYTSNPLSCTPLQRKELNIDWRGNVTICSQLSGDHDTEVDRNILCNLSDTSFSGACELLGDTIEKLRTEKQHYFNNYKNRNIDYVPCWHCLHYFKKLSWLKDFPENPWSAIADISNMNKKETTYAESKDNASF